MRSVVLLSLLCMIPLPLRSQVAVDPAPPGKMFVVAGHRLHMNCQGKGSPTVVMDSGAGDFSFDWAHVQPEVARFTRVCTYDRAGYAWSEPGPMPRTLGQLAYELHTLCEKAGIMGPIVLVGHSLGGLIVRRYAADFPKDVAGIVFVDSAHEDQLVGTTDRNTGQGKIVPWLELARDRPVPPIKTSVPDAASAGASTPTRSAGPDKVGSPFDKLPAAAQRLRLWAVTQPNFVPARISEFDFVAEELAALHTARLAMKYPLGDLPVIVLTAGVREPTGTPEETRRLSEDHTRVQNDLAALSRNSRHVTSPIARHHIQIDDPTIVVRAIRDLVNAVKAHKKVSDTK